MKPRAMLVGAVIAYTFRSNARRAARRQFGAASQEGVDWRIVTEKVAEGGPPLYSVAAVRRRRTQRKGTRLERLLRRPAGVRLAELQKLLGWQAHTVRGAISTLAKKLGATVISERLPDGGRLYRLKDAP